MRARVRSSLPGESVIKLIILDFDGVIIESNAVKMKVFGEIFGRFPEHAAGMRAYVAANINAPRLTVFRHLVHERLGRAADDGMVDDLVAEFSTRTLNCLSQCELVRGAAEFLSRYYSRVPLFLASVTPAADLERTVAAHKLTRYFSALYGCPPWTKPGAVRHILERECAAPADALLIGDTEGDLLAARETGVTFIARDSGASFSEELPEIYPDLFAIADAINARMQ